MSIEKNLERIITDLERKYEREIRGAAQEPFAKLLDKVYGPEREEPCVHGHFDCAVRERGACANEQYAAAVEEAWEASYDAVEALLFNDPAWEQIPATVISDIAHEAADKAQSTT